MGGNFIPIYAKEKLQILTIMRLTVWNYARRLRDEMAKTDPPDLNLLYRAGVLVVLSRDMNTLSWACQVPF
jgi:hypothetical protein